jgi:hypothetical protein
MKKSFVIHKDSLCILDRLSDEQAGKLFKAIRDIQNGIEPTDDILIQIALEPFVQQFKRDEMKWQSIADRNSINGAKGGRPRQHTDNEQTQINPKNPVGYSETQITQANPSEPKKAVSVSVSVSGSVSDSVSDSECIVEQSSPTPTPKPKPNTLPQPAQGDILDYMIEYTKSKNQSFAKSFLETESAKMFNYYESKGWIVGKSPMKNWKAAARNWLLNSQNSNNFAATSSAAERPTQTNRTIYT